MKKQARKSDSIKNEPNSSLSSPKNAKKQIRGKSKKGMFVGIDLHKKFLQVAVMDDKGKILHNDKVENNQQAIKQYFKKIPKRANIVMESSSVWHDVYRFLTETLRYKNVTLSNPYLTKAIAASKN